MKSSDNKIGKSDEYPIFAFKIMISFPNQDLFYTSSSSS